MGRLIFSGHETFTCKQFWLKKGFDYLKEQKKFTDKTSVSDLGVGKNMVGSIRFWLHAFGVSVNKEKPSKLGEFLFGEAGKDLFLEDIGSVWLLHYFLVKRAKASTYHFVFNEFRKTRNEFTKEQLHTFLKQKCEANSSTPYNENTINKDINVFIRNYIKPSSKKAEIEDAYSGLLHELNLIIHTRKNSVDWYYFESDLKESLPYQVVLFSILDNPLFENSISFKELLVTENSPARVFAINAEGLYLKIQEMTEKHEGITYSETAGNRVLQIDSTLNKWNILNEYYQ